MKKIMVLAGGNDQIYLIESLRKRFKKPEIILVDYLNNPVAKRYADRHLQISTLDMQQVLKSAVEEKIDGIITACTDQALVTMAYVAEKMGLKSYLTYEQAKRFTDKQLMKDKMINCSIPTARYYPDIFQLISEDENKINLSYPLVVKPVDCNSSKGIRVVTDEGELKNAYEIAMRMSQSGKVIVEEFIDGNEYSIDAYVVDGKVTILAITETKKINSIEKKFVINQSCYKYEIFESLEKVAKDILKKIVLEFNYFNGPLLLQALKNERGLYAIEFSARIGGGNKVQLIRAISGVDVLNLMLDTWEGKNVEVLVQKCKKMIHMNYIYGNEGVLDRIEGTDLLVKNNIVDSVFYYKSKGAKVNLPSCSSDRILGYMVSGDSEKELDEKEEKFAKIAKVYDNENRSMIE